MSVVPCIRVRDSKASRQFGEPGSHAAVIYVAADLDTYTSDKRRAMDEQPWQPRTIDSR